MKCREDEEEEEEEEEGRRGGAWINSWVPALGRSFPCARAGPTEASSIPGTPSTEPRVASLSPTVPQRVLSHYNKHLLCARPRQDLGMLVATSFPPLAASPMQSGRKKKKEKANRVTDDNKINKTGFRGEKSRGASRKSQLWVGRGFVVVSGWDKTEQTEYQGESGARCAGNGAESRTGVLGSVVGSPPQLEPHILRAFSIRSSTSPCGSSNVPWRGPERQHIRVGICLIRGCPSSIPGIP